MGILFMTRPQPTRIAPATLNAMARRLARHLETCAAPVKQFMALQDNDPYKVLICTVLSARTRDQVTLPVSAALLAAAPDAAALRKLPLPAVEAIVHPCGFYRTKASHLKALAQRLGAVYADRVPDCLADLLTLPGVGRKTANLVLALGYAQAALSVDIHVHRISNRLGCVVTRTPEQTESALSAVVPKRLWRHWNPWLVALGQTICLPRQPRCPICPLEFCCAKRLG